MCDTFRFKFLSLSLSSDLCHANRLKSSWQCEASQQFSNVFDDEYNLNVIAVVVVVAVRFVLTTMTGKSTLSVLKIPKTMSSEIKTEAKVIQLF